MILANLLAGTLIERYRRFFVDVQTETGIETLHCANTGSMKSLLEQGQKCWYSLSDNPKRKLRGSLEILETPQKGLALVNTQRPNAIVKEFLQNSPVKVLGQTCSELKPEFKQGHSRFDFGGTLSDGQDFVLEVKNVTLRLDNGMLAFPDAITTRGQKHLEELILCHEQGMSSHLLFLLSRNDAQGFQAQNPFDPEYQRKLDLALKSGVQIHLAYLDLHFEDSDLHLSIPKVEHW